MSDRPHDEQDRAEELDGDRLGERPGQVGMPGIVGYPPDQPLGAEDPTMLEGSSEADDSPLVRDWRTEPETAIDDDRGMRVVDTDEGLGLRIDDDGAAVAGSLVEHDDLSAEEDAVREAPQG